MTPPPAPRYAALAQALAVVTDTPPAFWAAARDILCVTADQVIYRVDANPPRARLVTREPREAWEAMATRGVIPEALFASPARDFEACACDDVPARDASTDRTGFCTRCGDHRCVYPAPPTVALAVALAANAADVLGAEAIARAFSPHARVRWHTRALDRPPPDGARDLWGLRRTLAQALGGHGDFPAMDRELAALGYRCDHYTMRGDARDLVALCAPPLANLELRP